MNQLARTKTRVVDVEAQESQSEKNSTRISSKHTLENTKRTGSDESNQLQKEQQTANLWTKSKGKAANRHKRHNESKSEVCKHQSSQ